MSATINRITTIILFSILFLQSYSQGLEFMSTEDYKALPPPPMMVGSSTSGGNELPEKYIIPESAFPEPGSQGSLGSCTGWATGYAFMSYYLGQKNNWDAQKNAFSPGYVYHSVRTCSDCSCGSYISYALDMLKNTGSVPLSTYPYDEDNCSRPASSLQSEAQNYKIRSWSRLNDVYNFNDLKTYLRNDQPIIIACNTNDAFGDFWNKKENDIFSWSSPIKGGGHAMLLVGYDDTKKAFKIMNSWSTNWGYNGFAWIDYQTFRYMIQEAYIVAKDYDTDFSNENDIVVQPDYHDNLDMTDDEYLLSLVDVVVLYEELEEEWYYFTNALIIADEITDKIEKVVYYYNDPDFVNQEIVVYNAPYYTSSYEGWGCITDMEAHVFLTDGNVISFGYDACEFLENVADYEDDEEFDEYEYIEVTPTVEVYETDAEGKYKFSVQLHGLSLLADEIEKVVYDRGEGTGFSERYFTTNNSKNNYDGGYTGWGCLTYYEATVYFTDGTTEVFEIDMCYELGWE